MHNAVAQIASFFKSDPVGYANVVLGVTLTPDQERILKLLVVPPYKVLVPAAHLVGKSFLAATAACWFYDTRESIVLTTAPTEKQTDIIWQEMRLLRPWGSWVGPKANALYDSPKHFARGQTARDSTAWQGWHALHVGIIFDEAVGIEPHFWEAAESMLCGQSHFFLAAYNPTDQSSYAYTAERSGHYHVVHLNAFGHPNIAAELAGRPAPYPSAIRLARLDELVRQWCTPLGEPPTPQDIQWPPGSGKWWRPGPVAECRLAGRWPTLASNSVWTEALFELAATLDLADDGPLVFGVDPARFGSDFTAIHGRKGGVSIHHESYNGWSTSQTAARCHCLAEEYGARYGQPPKEIEFIIDDTGVGSGVTDQAGGYKFVGLNAAGKPFAHAQQLYPNRRSEMWFSLAEAAARKEVSFARLPQHVRDDLRRELLAPLYKIDYAGRRVVERKDETKKRLGRSPDNADAVLLAFAETNTPRVTTFIGNPSAVPPPPQGPVFGWPAQSLVVG